MGAIATGAGSVVGAGGVAAAASDQPVVAMQNNAFDPVGLHVEPGTTVRFELEEGSHSATAYADRIPADAEPFDSGVIDAGSFEHTFEVPGTYDYYCIPHESMGMVGRIVVGEPGGPAEESPIPAGSVPDSERIVDAGRVSASEDDGSHGGMMDSDMMGGGGPGWMVLMPLGFLSVVLASVGGVTYWASKRGASAGGESDSAMARLREEYAAGEIDDEEFERRRERLRR